MVSFLSYQQLDMDGGCSSNQTHLSEGPSYSEAATELIDLFIPFLVIARYFQKVAPLKKPHIPYLSFVGILLYCKKKTIHDLQKLYDALNLGKSSAIKQQLNQ